MKLSSVFIAFSLLMIMARNVQAQWFKANDPPAQYELDLVMRNIKTPNSTLSSDEINFIYQMYTEVYGLTHPDVIVNTFVAHDNSVFTTLRPIRGISTTTNETRRSKHVVNLRLHATTSLSCMDLHDGSKCILPGNSYIIIQLRRRFCRMVRAGPFPSLQQVHGCSISYKTIVTDAMISEQTKKKQQQQLRGKNTTSRALYTEHVKMVFMNLPRMDVTAVEAKFLEDAWVAVYQDLNQGSRVHRVQLTAQTGHHLPTVGSHKNTPDPPHRRNAVKSYFHYWYSYFSVDAYCNLCFGQRKLTLDDDAVVEDDDKERRSLNLSTKHEQESPLFDEALMDDFENELCDVLRNGPHQVFHGLGDCIVYYDHPDQVY